MFGVPTQHIGSQGTPPFITLTSKTHHSVEGIFVNILCICFSFSSHLSEYRKSITISVICESWSPIYQIVSGKLSLENSKLYKECMCSLMFLPISFVITCKELKIAQIPQINQIYPLLNSICHVYTYGDAMTMTSAEICIFFLDCMKVLSTICY